MNDAYKVFKDREITIAQQKAEAAAKVVMKKSQGTLLAEL